MTTENSTFTDVTIIDNGDGTAVVSHPAGDDVCTLASVQVGLRAAEGLDPAKEGWDAFCNALVLARYGRCVWCERPLPPAADRTNRFRRAHEALGTTQAATAAALGLTGGPSYVCDILAGRREPSEALVLHAERLVEVLRLRRYRAHADETLRRLAEERVPPDSATVTWLSGIVDDGPLTGVVS